MGNLKKNLIEDLRKNKGLWFYLILGIAAILCPIPEDIPNRDLCAIGLFFGGVCLIINSVLLRHVREIADLRKKIEELQSYLERLGCDDENEEDR